MRGWVPVSEAGPGPPWGRRCSVRAASWVLLSWYHEYLPIWVFSPAIGPKWHGAPFPSLPIWASQPSGEKGRKKAPHPHFTDEDTHACARVRVCPAPCLTSPTPALEESKHAKPSHLRSSPLAPRPSVHQAAMPLYQALNPSFREPETNHSSMKSHRPALTAPKLLDSGRRPCF